MLLVLSGNGGMAEAMLIFAVATLVMPFTAIVAAGIGIWALRSGISWGGIRIATAVLATPYALGFLVAGVEGVTILLQTALSGHFEGQLLAVTNPVAAFGLLLGVLWRRRNEAPASPSAG